MSQENKFFFDDKRGNRLMAKINLRNIDAYAKQWEHPCRGLFKVTEAVQKAERDILKAPKKMRELYCVSILALALQDEARQDWWIHIPNTDPPDGLVMTLTQGEKSAKGWAREVEVVEHRGKKEDLLNTILEKLNNTSYIPDTIFVCLVLTSGVYDLESISKELQRTQFASEHVFLVFNGKSSYGVLNEKEAIFNFSLVQLAPVFTRRTFDLRKYLEDFKEKYKVGRELRIIENGQIYYGTANPMFTNSSVKKV
jgi:hypothetical protein